MSAPSSPAPSSKASSLPAADPADPLRGKGGGKKGNNDMTQTLILQMLMNLRDQISEQGKILKCLQVDMGAQGVMIQDMDENLQHVKWALWEEHRSKMGIWGAEVNVPEIVIQKWLKSREKMQQREKELLEGGILLNNREEENVNQNNNSNNNTTTNPINSESAVSSQENAAASTSITEGEVNRRRILEECFSIPYSAIRSRAEVNNPVEEMRRANKRVDILMEEVATLRVREEEKGRGKKGDDNDNNLVSGEEEEEEEGKMDDDNGRDNKRVGEEGKEE